MASSIPQYHHSADHNLYCNQFCDFPPPLAGAGNISAAAAMWVFDEGLPFFDNIGALDTVPPEPHEVVPSSFSMTAFPERFGVSDMAVPALPDFDAGLRGISGSEYHHENVCEFGEEYCNGLVPDFRTVYAPSSNDNWGYQVSQVVPAMEEPNMKVGKYSVEERKDRILRYLKKRNQRNFNKTIKYACRKTLADKRVRVRGRFAKNNELCEGEAVNKKSYNPDHDDSEFYYHENVKIKQDDGEDNWLQEAMASLVYLPFISG